MDVTTTADVELVLDARARLGEGPIWDDETGQLVWVDILEGIVHRTSPGTGRDVALDVGRTVGSVGLRRGGGLVLATDDGFHLQDPGGTTTRRIAAVEADDPLTRMNDGKVDPQGRFWAGTMAFDEVSVMGSLYRLDPEGSVTTMLTGVGISNGIDWSGDGSTMYFIDSPTGGVDTFRWDGPTGTIADRRRLVTIGPDGEGKPDGMTLDAEGYLWVACWDGWRVRRYAPDGTFDREIRFPAAHVSSVAFGGPDLDELYVTTAWHMVDPAERAAQPLGGSLFRCRPGVRGRPANRFAG
jgi:sugar lactone lactonase YvrE